MELQRLYPGGAPTTTEGAAAALQLHELAPPERPYVVLNMISTADGKATIAGRTGPIGQAADRSLFHDLRTQVDAVMVGAGTVRVERYGRLVRDPLRRERRREQGLEPDPLALVVSGRLDLTSDVPLLQDPESRVLILTASRGEVPGCAARVEYLRGPRHPLQLAPMLARLRQDHGIRSVLCEGGPALNSALIPEGLVDELFLCVSPKLIGGSDALTIVAGSALPEPVEMELLWCLESEGHLFTRWRVDRPA